ncbi:hypothetical protein COLO4_07468 [Corchorus olitorius]|uniref:Uncharacterized protein n=1 Tax=Corchorus olitorius TaxID=93759 RepID=A0A1R3KJN3_9ROSI|nr:hypothetical protein COLO4_07468 [Corchorus olitorius]
MNPFLYPTLNSSASTLENTNSAGSTIVLPSIITPPPTSPLEKLIDSPSSNPTLPQDTNLSMELTRTDHLPASLTHNPPLSHFDNDVSHANQPSIFSSLNVTSSSSVTSIPQTTSPNTALVEFSQDGFEPTTSQLTADRSTTELLRNNGRLDLIEFNSRSQPMTNMNSKFPSSKNTLITSHILSHHPEEITDKL